MLDFQGIGESYMTSVCYPASQRGKRAMPSLLKEFFFIKNAKIVKSISPHSLDRDSWVVIASNSQHCNIATSQHRELELKNFGEP